MLFDPHTTPSPRKLRFMAQGMWPNFWWEFDDTATLCGRNRRTLEIVARGNSVAALRISMLQYTGKLLLERENIKKDLKATKERFIKGWTDVEAS